ncbi:carboxypeptidase M32 [Laceyella putida]|uniref:Metal-dependent carboxypeptidase n=1 Tax=Laceyella putida TaxID=110101 RepID=A0ABW2RG34_9BACL
MEKKLQELKKRLKEIYDIHSSMSLLNWDQNTYMPKLAGDARGSQMATLGRIAHEKMTDSRLGELLDELAEQADQLPFDSNEASLIRVAKREYEKETKVPAEFISRFYQHTSQTYQAWVEARAEDDFGKVAPYLEQTLELSREYAHYFPGFEHIADPLIDRADYGMKANALRVLFGELREQLVPLVEQVTALPAVSQACIKQTFPKEKQLAYVKELIGKMGFDFDRGRLDLAPHPFMIKFAHGDVRITTRVNEQDLSEVLFSTIHETGHALYELGIDARFEGTPLHRGTSSGVHESQSRLWENIVGRSRGFWEAHYPSLQAAFPAQLGNVTLDEFYRAINHVERSLIRTDADELTYNLHVIIRFDLELAMLEGNLKVKDLPEMWRHRYQSDLGIAPSDDKHGVLQDIHWYFDFIGGMFQGYTLGNILSCQFYDAACQAHPEIPSEIAKGNVSVLHGWLKEHVYRHGGKWTATELVRRATGSDMTIAPYIAYLKRKAGELYLDR